MSEGRKGQAGNSTRIGEFDDELQASIASRPLLLVVRSLPLVVRIDF
jgi:hypothetical protein